MYKVIKTFTDLQDGNYKYITGDTYPRNGLKVSKKRIEELSTTKNRRGIILIEEVEEEVKPEAEEVVVEEAPKKRSRKKKEDVENAD